MKCNTCKNRNICKYTDDFNELYTKASNDVYGGIFNMTCNEYQDSEEFNKYLGMTNEEIAQDIFNEIIEGIR